MRGKVDSYDHGAITAALQTRELESIPKTGRGKLLVANDKTAKT
jgi:hypothetical protein